MGAHIEVRVSWSVPDGRSHYFTRQKGFVAWREYVEMAVFTQAVSAVAPQIPPLQSRRPFSSRGRRFLWYRSVATLAVTAVLKTVWMLAFIVVRLRYPMR